MPKDPWRVNEESRRRQLREDASRPLAVNLAEGLALSDPSAENLARLEALLRELGGKACSLEHLLEMKRSSDRPRDRDDLDALEATQESGREGN